MVLVDGDRHPFRQLNNAKYLLTALLLVELILQIVPIGDLNVLVMELIVLINHSVPLT